jgi:hypothetical protein
MSTNVLRGQSIGHLWQNIRLQRGLAFGTIILTALIAFEAFNYSTTDFALASLLGDLQFLGLRWATILAIAFCAIDFAGIARLFTPEQGAGEIKEVWYLFGAWLLAATMNAMLTWWGVSMAIMSHETLANTVVSREVLLRIVPIFVAVLVWLIRVLIIGTFSVAGDRLFSVGEPHLVSRNRGYTKINAKSAPARSLNRQPQRTQAVEASSQLYRPAPKPSTPPEVGSSRPDPTYHPLSMSSAMRPSDSGTGAQVRQ